MIPRALICLVIMLSLASQPIPVEALTITNQLGDNDGFGLGVGAGQSFDWQSLPGRSTASGSDITDVITDNAMFTSVRPGALSLTWSQTFDLSELESVESASIELFTGGLSAGGDFYVDDSWVGGLQPGIDGSAWLAQTQHFDLFPFMSLLSDGVATFSIDVPVGANNFHSNLVLDYSLLTFAGPAATASVPEPSTMLLLGVGGVLGVVASRRRRSELRLAA
jgi:hypothetical protein